MAREIDPLCSIYADLHIHIGRTQEGNPVKITASRQMTFSEVIHESYHRKGLQLIGVIDAHSPAVQREIYQKLETGEFQEHRDGGIVYQGVTCLLGAEIEIKEPHRKPAHVLVYLPTLEKMVSFTKWLSKYMKNVELSTQRLYQPVTTLIEQVKEREGIFIPAHIFTPFKSALGSAADRLSHLFPIEQLDAVELGLSSDCHFADQISELSSLTFLTNSDAHSIPKIGREHNELLMKEASFQEWKKVLHRTDGRKVLANYGLNPRLGKYYRSRCLNCGDLWPAGQNIWKCPACGGQKRVKGVRDRIEELSDQPSMSPAHRSPYIYQVPLQMLPGIGPKTFNRLLEHLGTEMNILHQASREEIAAVTNERVADQIIRARKQQLNLVEGGGGKYGKVQR